MTWQVSLQEVGAIEQLPIRYESCPRDLFFRPFGAGSFPHVTHGLRRGLHSYAASRLGDADAPSLYPDEEAAFHFLQRAAMVSRASWV